ncbi:cohesin domain-containing protein [Clostridium felsineum]|uniref:Cellulosomal-scaffolding protein A n=1 Tax=Clostridium felsineum TaxID=36839 RepID=A0A1S8LPC3_9CLOT|nr:cohesin domain-containing protein [Clostridium felsineum]URZ01442.1 Cellulosomal-scaffolding protein A [Clostridium felsineum]URZ05714.1 Cellulosomal-scaffolding protein A [Clostridium felsineum]URZ10753.1 Cellulosomal-scaffolding protein A [Clostridium felsineum]URZ15507.1 Cellulosomal-scaffolding protein A [Clostridium felsineum DSM 794]
MRKKGIVVIAILSLIVISMVGCKSKTADTNIIKTDKPTIKIEDASGKKGDNVKVKIITNKVSGKNTVCCDFKIKYDPNNFEVSKVVPGSILKDPKDNFDYTIDGKNGIVSFLYSYTDKNLGKELISTDGEFATINIKVKNEAKKGKSQISFNDKTEFYDKGQKPITVASENGEIDIK